MAVHHLTAARAAASTPATTAAAPVTAAGAALATARIALGAVFLWAFADKTFGLGYSTADGRAWIDGASPTKGFLSHVAAGPLRETFHSMAGQAWADWMFMLGLLGLGLALVGGVGLRIAAGGGTVLLTLMWAAEWPPARHLADGGASGSTNPLLDYHVVYALLFIALAATGAGRTWGLARRWAALPVVRDHAWLR
ncbi:DoxX family membrane protein [Kitasatospora putterlickiae]|uniref:DoxX family membrane protein n=1 Tax=Kitasatospora putterlickiae TaxID=221725 RepID=A0ABN1YAA7_9ACTN